MNKYEELIKIKELLDSGAVTEEEYNSLKKEILEKDFYEDTSDCEVTVAIPSPEPETENNTSGPVLLEDYEQPAPTYNQPAPAFNQYVPGYDQSEAELEAEIKKWHTIAIVTIILSILFGLIALFSNKSARAAFEEHDYDTARQKLKVNKIMLWVAIGGNLLFLIGMIGG